MIGYKLGVLLLQRNLVYLHNSEHNEKKLLKCVEKYSEKGP
jgi:hypothetical protein